MTRKNISISLLAASLISTVAFATTGIGAIGVSKVANIGTERLSMDDVNVSLASDANVTYTPKGIPAGSLKNPIFKYTFANAKDIVVGNASVYEVEDGNESNVTEGNLRLVADTPTVSGSDKNVISFNAVDGDIYVYNDKKYIISDSNKSFVTNINMTVSKGATSSVTLNAALYSGDSQALNDDTPNATVYNLKKEYTASIVTPFDAKIDASAKFFNFTNTVTDDMLTVKVNQATDIIASGRLIPDSQNLIVYSDQNISAFVKTRTYQGITQGTENDFNTTCTIDAANTDSNITYTVDGAKKILKTSFGADIFLKKGTTEFPLIKKTTDNAGKWVIYGYNAQIPNAAGLENFQTVLKFTNRSGIDSEIYFTLIDPAGTAVDLSSVDLADKIPAIAKNATSKYKVSDLVSLATAKDANFDGTGSVSIEVSIPTTPDLVYGMASFKNVTLGQFKDLPVYNNSNLNY